MLGAALCVLSVQIMNNFLSQRRKRHGTYVLSFEFVGTAWNYEVRNVLCGKLESVLIIVGCPF